MLVFVVTVLLLLLGCYYLYRRQPPPKAIKRQVKGIPPGVKKSILLIGHKDAGKTTLFTKLAFGDLAKTVPSAKENIIPVKKCIIKLPVVAQNMHLVDLPVLSPAWIEGAIIIVLLIDSTQKRAIRTTAETLLNLYDSICARNIPLIIYCSKSDDPGARSMKTIELELSKELSHMSNQGKTNDLISLSKFDIINNINSLVSTVEILLQRTCI